MAERNVGEELGRELVVKGVMWLPAIVGAALLGPLGVLLGLGASVAVVSELASDSAPPSDPDGNRGRSR
jgi:hypothetical protein